MTTTIDTSLSPLVAVRAACATEIETGTGWDVTDGARGDITTPIVVLEPRGWARTGAAPTVVMYQVAVTCLYNRAEAAVPGAEEMARQVYTALSRAGWVIPEVPPVGTVTYAERDFVGAQFTAGTTLDLGD